MKKNCGVRSAECGMLLFAALLFAFISLISSSALAQSGRKTPGTKNPSENADVRIDTSEVRVPIRAYNSVGKPLTDLTLKDFVVIENGAGRQVTSLKFEPANILLVLDLSNEIGTYKNGESDRANMYSDHKDYEKIEDKDLIRQKPRPLIEDPAPREFAYNFVDNLATTDRVAIIQYADKTQLIQDWTLDHKAAREALASKFRTGIKSTFHDALALSAKKLEECVTGRRVVVLLSDGFDSASKISRNKAMDALMKTEASIFVVSWTELLRSEVIKAMQWNGANEAAGSRKFKRHEEFVNFLRKLDGKETELKALAELTGGEFYLPTRFKFFVRQPPEIIKDIGTQYMLTYLTEKDFVDANYRSIQILGARSGLTVKSKKRRYSGD